MSISKITIKHQTLSCYQRQRQTTHITQEPDPSSSIITVEIASCNNIFQVALRTSTVLKYKTYQTKWKHYCMQNNRSHIQPKISELLDYFTYQNNSVASFATIFIYFKAPAHYEIFQRCPWFKVSNSKNNIFSAVKILLDYFGHKGENNQLSNKKLLILILLLGGQRMNTAYFFTVDRITAADIRVTFSPPNHVPRYSKPGRKLDSFHYRAYHIKKLCVVDWLKQYLKCRNTSVQADTKALSITYDKPFRADFGFC